MNKPKLPSHHIYSAQAMLQELTGIDLNEDQFLEYANYALSQIGRNVEWVKMKVVPDDLGEVELPCELLEVRCVADDDLIYGDWEVVNVGVDGKMRADRRTVRTNFNPSVYDGLNTMVNFSFTLPNLLRVSEDLCGEAIYVLGKAPLVDLTDGLPLLYEKQVLAVAWYCAYLKTQRDMFAGIEPGIDFAYLRTKALNLVADARVPESISDNEMEAILDAKVSFGRKSYGKPSQLW